MGFLDIARAKAQWMPQTLADLDNQILAGMSSTPVSSGVRVTEETAMRFAAVGICTTVIAQTMASTPLEVKRRRRDGRGADIAYDHPAYQCLHYAPNEEMPSYNYVESQMVQELLSGDCFAFPHFVDGGRNSGRLEKLIPVPWTMIKPVRDKKTRKLQYEYTDDRGEKHLLPADAGIVFHVPGLGWDGVKGLSVVRNAAECIGIGLATSEFAGKFFSNGMNIGGLLTVDSLPSQKGERDEFLADLAEKYGGLGNAYKVLVLRQGSDYKPIRGAMPLAEAQFLEYCKFNFAEVCGWFRVPLYMTGQMDRATDNNTEKSGLEFYKGCMVNWYRRWEQWINFKLFTPADRVAGYFAEFNAMGLLRGDSKTQSDVLHREFQDGNLTPNEWREYTGRNPIDDPNADRLYVNGNMIPLEMAGTAKPQSGGAGGDKDDA